MQSQLTLLSRPTLRVFLSFFLSFSLSFFLSRRVFHCLLLLFFFALGLSRSLFFARLWPRLSFSSLSSLSSPFSFSSSSSSSSYGSCHSPLPVLSRSLSLRLDAIVRLVYPSSISRTPVPPSLFHFLLFLLFLSGEEGSPLRSHSLAEICICSVWKGKRKKSQTSLPSRGDNFENIQIAFVEMPELLFILWLKGFEIERSKYNVQGSILFGPINQDNGKW